MTMIGRTVLALAALAAISACGSDSLAGTSASSFTISVNGGDPATVNAGGTAYVDIDVVRNGAASVPVTLSAVSLPSGITVSFDPPVVTESDTYSTMIITVGPSVSAGEYTIGLQAQASGAAVTKSLTLSVSALTILTSGTPVPAISGSEMSERLYSISVPEGASLLDITASVGSGTIDLLVKQGSTPALGDADCDEWFGDPLRCTFENPAAGEWYVMLYGTSAYSGVTLTATFSVPLPTLNLSQITAGHGFACGLTTAGKAYCWGNGYQGRLGTGDEETHGAPVAVNTTLTFSGISAGDGHACALTPGGAAWCWGSNPDGMVGDGTTQNRLSPVPVSGGLTFVALDAGDSHTCGLTAAGAMYCWGGGIWGAIGDGTLDDRFAPVPVSGGHAFEKIFVDGSVSCAIESSGAAWCWGSNTWGELGDGTTIGRRVPTAVAGGLAFKWLAPGSSHSCGITTDGTAYCWGYNAYGQLGTGDQTFAMEGPVPVSTTVNFSRITTGGDHSCGIATTGTAYCWGAQLAGGAPSTGSYQFTPRAVAGTTQFTEISAGAQYNLAVAMNGKGYVWGYGSSALGVGTTDPTSFYEPTPIAPPER